MNILPKVFIARNAKFECKGCGAFDITVTYINSRCMKCRRNMFKQMNVEVSERLGLPVSLSGNPTMVRAFTGAR